MLNILPKIPHLSSTLSNTPAFNLFTRSYKSYSHSSFTCTRNDIPSVKRLNFNSLLFSSTRAGGIVGSLSAPSLVILQSRYNTLFCRFKHSSTKDFDLESKPPDKIDSEPVLNHYNFDISRVYNAPETSDQALQNLSNNSSFIFQLTETLIETVHTGWNFFGLAVPGCSWWVSIVLSTVILRSFVTLPVAVYQQRTLKKVMSLKPLVTSWARSIQQFTRIETIRLRLNEKQAKKLYKKQVKPYYTFLPLFAQHA
ncbi:hypothetical protein BB561_000082 [Smittium simulii]|uniref:Uncharacterized protein n=1 Tax=Smittium simulii TaxID=133385 RepID=A0A2T9Z0U1_9FUNG|nr:hypothetical protein BB561_000082 [Smittium simulii]